MHSLEKEEEEEQQQQQPHNTTMNHHHPAIPLTPRRPISPKRNDEQSRKISEYVAGNRRPMDALSSCPAATSSGIHRPLHQSSPTLGDTPAPPAYVAMSRSNPTMSISAFKGGRRSSMKNGANASFSNMWKQQEQQQHPLQKSVTAKTGSRTSLVGLDKIMQRSSSKTVKQTLCNLEELACCTASSTSIDGSAAISIAAPWKEVKMLLELSTDVYYRVVMKKCGGLEILKKLILTFPELKDPCQELISALTTPAHDDHHDGDEVVGPTLAVSPRSTRVLLEPRRQPPRRKEEGDEEKPSFSNTSVLDCPSATVIDKVLRMRSVSSDSPTATTTTTTSTTVSSRTDASSSLHKPQESTSSEDIVQIINEGCQEYLMHRAGGGQHDHQPHQSAI